jgi:hypothetical protein
VSESIRPESAERVRDFYRNQGADRERERIIEILQTQLSCTCEYPISHAIKLIKEGIK